MQTRKRQMPIVILFFLSVLITSCTQQNKFENDKAELIEIITSSDCVLPCWRNITPGVTTVQEARERVLEMFSTSSAEIQVPPTFVDQLNLADGTWMFLQFEEQNLSVNFSIRDQIVDKISFHFRGYKLRLNDVLGIMGDPTMVNMCHENIEVRRALIHIENTVADAFFVQGLPVSGNSFTISYGPDTEIDALDFYAPRDIPLYDFSFPWLGYGENDFILEQQNQLSTCPHH